MKGTLRKLSPVKERELEHYVQIIKEEARIAELGAEVPDA